MARIPYADLGAPEVQPLVQRIVAERGSVLHLYQMLMHSPPLAEGWLALMTQVRQKLSLPGALRELVIMRIAHLNGAPYEAHQHAPIALKEGLSQAQLDALPQWRDAAEAYSSLERDVLALCDAMTREVQVDEAVVQAVRAALGERQLVELVGTIASYNMVSRFLEALAIHASDAR
jgi:AhpD family alkylhydroperoxidase